MRVRRTFGNVMLDLRAIRWLTGALWRPMLSQLRYERRRPRRSFGRR